MKMQKMTKTGLLTLALGATLTGAANAVEVQLNGQPLMTETAPVVQNGRVLVPMRDIFESLGATVNYSPLTREIAAVRGGTTVRLALGSRNATLNNVPVTLDVPANAVNGRTLVPLRFVSEAMGANVAYNPSNRLVSIRDTTLVSNPGSGSQVGGFRQITVPADAVVKVRLDQELSSATAMAGQTFTATVVSNRIGDSEFPAGTKLRGQVVAAEKRDGDRPGALELRFIEAILPDNSTVRLDGVLVGLDSKNVQNVGGRVVATGEAKKNNSAAVIGIGAGAGYLLGRILDRNELVTTIIGGAAGYLYDQSQRGKVGDAVLATNQEIGVRLRSGVTYRDTTNYADDRDAFLRL